MGPQGRMDNLQKESYQAWRLRVEYCKDSPRYGNQSYDMETSRMACKLLGLTCKALHELY